jgi:hypothetical protein
MTSLENSSLLAVTVDLNLGTVLFISGVVFLALGVLLGMNSTAGKGSGILGLVCLVGGYFATGGVIPEPIPIPGPYDPPPPVPQPTPIPQPSSFEAGVQQTFKQDGGTKEDAALLSALFGQMSDSLAFDGQQPQPRIASGNSLGVSFSRLQRYRLLQDTTTIGERFPNFERYVAGEIDRLGLNGQWDDAARKRADAELMFKAVSSALRNLP